MSYSVTTDIWCDPNLDDCQGWTAGVRGSQLLINDARKAAANNSWVFHDGKDICPTCWLEVVKTIPRGKTYLSRSKLSSLKDITRVCRMVLHEEQPPKWVASYLLVNVGKIHEIIREYGDDFENGRDLTKPKGKG